MKRPAGLPNGRNHDVIRTPETDGQERIIGRARAIAHPSLALIKYWGKADPERNIPATSSLALTLGALNTDTTVEVLPCDGENHVVDKVIIGAVEQNPSRFEPFFAALRSEAKAGKEAAPGEPFRLIVHSTSDFPSAAGLASSASGFAALAVAASAALHMQMSREKLSSLARLGSASAARSLWGGFVRLDAGAEAAQPVHDEHWWPELRVIVVQTADGPKAISSRKAMESVRVSSPCYDSWIRDSRQLMERALESLENRDLKSLGALMRLSYMRMFSTMFSADPPIIYWNPESLKVINFCERARAEGLSAWETMDAGPQVKIFCLSEELDIMIEKIQVFLPGLKYRVSEAGGASRIIES